MYTITDSTDTVRYYSLVWCNNEITPNGLRCKVRFQIWLICYRLLAVHNLSRYLQELAYHSHQVVREEDQQWEHWEPKDHSEVGERMLVGSK